MSLRHIFFRFTHVLLIVAVFPAVATSAPNPLGHAVNPTVVFEPNRGQTDPEVDFIARGPDYGIWLAPERVVIQARSRDDRSSAFELRWVDADPESSGEGIARVAGVANYLSLDGTSPSVSDVPRFARVHYQQVWPGIDLEYYGADGELEYDFVVAPGSDPSPIIAEISGQNGLSVDDDGSLVIATAHGDLVQRPPVSWQVDDQGHHRPVESHFVLAENRVSFALGEFDPSLPLRIDPVFTYATYIGGNGEDRANDVAVNAAGEAYVVGVTASTNLPVINARQPNFGGDTDGFLVKLAADGRSALVATYLGGANREEARAVALDASGNIFIAGLVQDATNHPTLFELKLSASAGQVVFSRTLPIPTEGFTVAQDVTTDPAGNLYVVGHDSSGTVPLVNAVSGHEGGTKGFVRKLAPDGTPLISRYIGTGTAQVITNAIQVGPGGDVWMSGWTYQPGAASQAFVLRMSGMLNAVRWSKQFGGSADERAYNMVVGADSSAYIAGDTSSSDFPGMTGQQQAFGGFYDAFVLRTDENGNQTAATYLGDSGYQSASGLGLDAQGRVHVALNWNRFNPYTNISVYRLTPSLTANERVVNYGQSFDTVEGLAVGSDGSTFVIGRAGGGSVVTPGAWMTAFPGGTDSGRAVRIDWSADPALSVANASATEGNSGNTPLVVTASVAGVPTRAVRGYLRLSGGTATSGIDYDGLPVAFEIPAGSLSVPISVTVKGDVLDEPNETFNGTLASVDGATITGGPATLTIVDDDPAPSVSIADRSCSEGNSGTSQCSLTITASAISGKAVSGTATSSNGSAVAGSDYSPLAAAPWSITAGQTQTTINLPILGDTLDEVNETLTVTLGSLANATAGDTSAVITITDDDAMPSVSIADRSCAEGHSGTSGCALTISLSAKSGRAISGTATSSNDTATAGSDYDALSATSWSISAGAQTSTINLTVRGDTLDEVNETLTVSLGNLINATAGDSSATISIVDDDAAPTVAVAERSCAEGNTGSSNCGVSIQLSAASGMNVSGKYRTANGSAMAGSDYGAVSNANWSIAPGATSTTVPVSVLGDTLDEPNETFQVTLSALANAAASGNDLGATITITDDDAPPVISILPRSCVEGNVGTTLCALNLSLSSASGKAVSGTASSSNGTATAGSDYDALVAAPWSIPPGNQTGTVSVSIRGDLLDEENETFNVTLAGLVNATAGEDINTGVSIPDDDAPAQLVVDSLECFEDIVDAPCIIQFALSTPSGREVHGTISSTDVTAIAGSDYQQINALGWSIPAGQSGASLEVSLINDEVAEPTETFSAALGSVTNATHDGSPIIVTVHDDDNPSGIVVGRDCAEGDAGSVACPITVQLQAVDFEDREFSIEAIADTATEGVDFAPLFTVLTIPAGELSTTVDLVILGDTTPEADETVLFELTDNSSRPGRRPEVRLPYPIAVIVDDDSSGSPGILQLATSATQVAEGATLGAAVTRVAGSSGNVSVRIAAVSGTAVVGTDVTPDGNRILHWDDGEVGRKTLSFVIVPDGQPENEETFVVLIDGPTGGAMIDEPSAISVTIAADDPALIFADGFSDIP